AAPVADSAAGADPSARATATAPAPPSVEAARRRLDPKPHSRPDTRQRLEVGVAPAEERSYERDEFRAPEPAPQPDAMFFREAGTHPFVATRADALSTFALDVDTGSYTLVRSYLERGQLPPPAAVRVEEIVNAMRYD